MIERSEAIVSFLARYAELKKGNTVIKVSVWPDEPPAIEEAERKAKAWDELEQSAIYSGRSWLIESMHKLIPPDPVDPLDELERWGKAINPEMGPFAAVHVETLLTKIRELKEKRK